MVLPDKMLVGIAWAKNTEQKSSKMLDSLHYLSSVISADQTLNGATYRLHCTLSLVGLMPFLKRIMFFLI